MMEEDLLQLRHLYLELSNEELEEVEETLTEYAALIIRMVKRRYVERRNKKRPGGLE